MERLRHMFDTLTADQIITHVPQRSHYVEFPYTEQAIIDLHALFITPGIHHIEIESLQKGRTLLEALLTSLNCYTAIACITTNEIAFMTDIYDCSHDLAMQPCIESFFAEQFTFDCMLIEPCQSLTRLPWYKKVEKYLYTSTISLHAPIIFVAYANGQK